MYVNEFELNHNKYTSYLNFIHTNYAHLVTFTWNATLLFQQKTKRTQKVNNVSIGIAFLYQVTTSISARRGVVLFSVNVVILFLGERQLTIIFCCKIVTVNWIFWANLSMMNQYFLVILPYFLSKSYHAFIFCPENPEETFYFESHAMVI